MSAPIGRIELALAGRQRVFRKTWPWRSQKDIDDEKAEELLESRGAPASTAAKLMGIFQGLAAARRKPQ